VFHEHFRTEGVPPGWPPINLNADHRLIFAKWIDVFFKA